MANKADSSSARIIGRMVHYDHHQIFSKRQRKYDILLCSDGTISSTAKHPLSGSPTNDVNIYTHNMRYFFPLENQPLRYRSMVLLCLVLSGVFFFFFCSWADLVYENGLTDRSLDAASVAPFLLPLVLWVIADTLVCKLGTPERMTVMISEEEKLTFQGKIPHQDLLNIARSVTLAGGIIGTVLALPDDSFFLMLLSFGVLGAMFYASLQGLLWLLNAQPSTDEVEMSCVQFFIAATEMRNGGKDSSPALAKEERDELSHLKEELQSFDTVLGRVDASRDIFSSSSPSLIVIAIGATTERLMFIACENVGIKRKTNARPTLHTFINEYQTKAELDPKTLTRLQLIKEFRNTATHHFNVEWDDSLLVLKQFCRFVEWFAEHHASDATVIPSQ
jgi:hypothetical protein